MIVYKCWKRDGVIHAIDDQDGGALGHAAAILMSAQHQSVAGHTPKSLMERLAAGEIYETKHQLLGVDRGALVREWQRRQAAA